MPSVGAAIDALIRDRVNQGVLPGPRILTFLRQSSGDIDVLRQLVRQTKDEGADVIKLFATTGLGAGGNQRMADEQIQAVCSEAKAVGLRSVVHAIDDSGARAAVLAGCTSIEHGTFLKDETLDLMAQRGSSTPTFSSFATTSITAPLSPSPCRRSKRWRRESSPPSMSSVAPALITSRSTSAPTPSPARTAATPRNSSTASTKPTTSPWARSPAPRLSRPNVSASARKSARFPRLRSRPCRHPRQPHRRHHRVRRVVFVMRAGRVYRNDR